MKGHLALLVVLWSLASHATIAASTVSHNCASLIDRGREIAMFRCSACHQVTSSQAAPEAVYNPDRHEYVPAPSFAAIAQMSESSPRFLQEFITAPSPPMPEHQFRPQDVAAIVAYIESMREPNGRPHFSRGDLRH
jgi:mono/diheme cytochrome c family protein